MAPQIEEGPARFGASGSPGSPGGEPVVATNEFGAKLRLIWVAASVIAIALGFIPVDRLLTAAREHGSQHRLVAAFARSQAKPGPHLPPPSGSAWGLLSIPHIAVDGLAVVEGATARNLRAGPAHDSASPLPGQRGAVVVMGHNRTYGGPFTRLGRLRVGDVITLQSASRLFVYRVSRSPQVLHSGPNASLALPSAREAQAGGGANVEVDHTLVLATGFGSDTSRLQVVVAVLDQAIAVSPAPGSGGPTVTATLRAVPGDRTATLRAAFWILTLLLVVCLARRLRSLVPPAVVYPVVIVLVTLATYQIYLGIDRVLPGTY